MEQAFEKKINWAHVAIGIAVGAAAFWAFSLATKSSAQVICVGDDCHGGGNGGGAGDGSLQCKEAIADAILCEANEVCRVAGMPLKLDYAYKICGGDNPAAQQRELR